MVLALSAGEPEIDKEKLAVYMPSQATIDLLRQKNNRDKINELVSGFSTLRIEFRPRLKLGEDNTVQYVMKMFGNDVKVKN